MNEVRLKIEKSKLNLKLNLTLTSKLRSKRRSKTRSRYFFVCTTLWHLCRGLRKKCDLKKCFKKKSNQIKKIEGNQAKTKNATSNPQPTGNRFFSLLESTSTGINIKTKTKIKGTPWPTFFCERSDRRVPSIFYEAVLAARRQLNLAHIMCRSVFRLITHICDGKTPPRLIEKQKKNAGGSTTTLSTPSAFLFL